MSKLEITYKDPRDLKPYENNARFNDHAVDDVAKSIEQFGFQQPIVVDRDLVIIAGHTRWKAACKLGLTEVPVSVADKLTPAQVAAYRLADNKVAEKSKWNKKALKDEFDLLKELNFDIDDLGFTEVELRSLTVDSIVEAINAEPEYVDQDDRAERRHKALVEKLNQLKARHRKKLETAKLLILAAGSNKFICIVDESLADFVAEVERNKAAHNETALDAVLDKVYPL